MKKRLVCFGIILCMLVTMAVMPVTAAQSGTCGENLTWTLDDNGTLTISGTGDMINCLSSPTPWDSSKSSIKTIIIENGVTSIGSCAFKNCTNLTSAEIPDSVVGIGSQAFYNCQNLTSINIPGGVRRIGDWTFYHCNNLKSVTINNGVTVISEYMFFCCSGLRSISIPESVTSIGEKAFGSCITLKTVTLPESITSIGRYAFEHCSKLTSINIPKGITAISNGVFQGCYLLSSIDIHKNITWIGENAFYSCSSLTTIELSDSVKTICSGAFSDCKSLTEIYVSKDNPNYSSVDGVLFNKDKTIIAACPGGMVGRYIIPTGVTKIDADAFYGCINISSIDIPHSVTIIGYSAFYNCPSLSDVYYDGIEEDWHKILIGDSNQYLLRATKHFNYIPEVTVTGISFDKSELVLKEGDTAILIATITPENATNKAITWVSSNEKIATVDQNGTVKAVSAGTATITVTTEDGGYTAECIIYIASDKPFVIGDLNGDGKVTPVDNAILARHLAGWTGYETLPYKK